MDLTTTELPLIVPKWSAPPSVVAYSTTRLGGLSQGIFAGLNVGDHVGDNTKRVAHNRALLPLAENIHWLNQVHSNVALALPNRESRGDSSYTSSLNQACAVMTADCVPILMTDSKGETVAAIHAGLKGLQTDIIANTVERAFTRNRSEVLAWIGPHISVQHYEVSEADAASFGHVDEAVLPSENQGKVMLNLSKIATLQLIKLGVTQIEIDGRCTYADEARFYSYRRAKHQNKANCGRMVSVIAIKESV